MVARKSPSSGKRRKSEPEEKVEDTDDESIQQEVSESKSSSNRKKGMSPRELRQSRRQDLRPKSTGVGISIASAADDGGAIPKGKKIIFGDDEDLMQEDDLEKKEIQHGDEKQQDEESDDDDDDDDAVEEVDTSAARKSEQGQREKERATARVQVSLTSRRKRKYKVEAEPENDFDDAFFTQLDEEIAEKQQQDRQKPVQPQGRHTTFVVPNEDETRTAAPVGHNIEVAVLASESSSQVIINPELSDSALTFSRSHLLDGSDGVSSKQLQKAKKSGNKTAETPSWRRSKKMNLLLQPGARSKRQKVHGRAPAHFVVE